jgi:hypothetical protein
MKIFQFSLMIALAIGLLNAEFTEFLIVQVFDQNTTRPIQGAEVYVSHQLNSIAGYVQTKPVKTNSSGLAYIVFTDYEDLNQTTEYDYTLYLDYGGGAKQTKELIGGTTTKKEPRTVTFFAESYNLNVQVTDQKGSPLQANIQVFNHVTQNELWNANTNSQGKAVFQLPSGLFDVRAQTSLFSKTEVVGLNKSSGDRVVGITVPLYTFSVSVVNDAGEPVPAEVGVGDLKAETNADGNAVFYNITEQVPTITVRSGKNFKTTTANLQSQGSIEIVFDTTPPEILSVEPSVSKSGAATIALVAQDPGLKASGVGSVLITYDAGAGSVPLSVYTVGYNSFEAKVPAQQQGAVVKYSLTVTDNEGNSVTRTGSYMVPKEIVKTSVEPIKKDNPFSGIPLEAIATGGIVFAIIVFGIIYYLKKRGEAEDATQPPAQGQQERPPGGAPPMSPPAQPPSAPPAL